MKFDIKLDTKEWEAALRALGAQAAPVARRALKRAAEAGRTQAQRDIAADTGLGSRFVKEELTVKAQDVSATLEVSDRRIPLIDFKARGPEPSRGRPGGVSWRNPGASRNRDPHAFITTTRRGKRGVYRRANEQRDSLFQLHGPSLGLVFRKVLPRVMERAREVLVERLRHEVGRAMAALRK